MENLPKTDFSGLATLELSMYVAVLQYNGERLQCLESCQQLELVQVDIQWQLLRKVRGKELPFVNIISIREM